MSSGLPNPRPLLTTTLCMLTSVCGWHAAACAGLLDCNTGMHKGLPDACFGVCCATNGVTDGQLGLPELLAGWSGLICGVQAGWAAAGLRAGKARGDCPMHAAGTLLSLGIVKAIGMCALAALSALYNLSWAPVLAVLSRAASCFCWDMIPGVSWSRCCCDLLSLLASIGVFCASAHAAACLSLGRTDGCSGDDLFRKVGVRSRDCTPDSPDTTGSF